MQLSKLTKKIGGNMYRKVTFVEGCGSHSKKWGYSRHYVFECAEVTEDKNFWIVKGEASIFKGEISKTFLRKEYVTIRKRKENVTLEILNNALVYLKSLAEEDNNVTKTSGSDGEIK
jgi:hypothetical protein